MAVRPGRGGDLGCAVQTPVKPPHNKAEDKEVAPSPQLALLPHSQPGGRRRSAGGPPAATRQRPAAAAPQAATEAVLVTPRSAPVPACSAFPLLVLPEPSWHRTRTQAKLGLELCAARGHGSGE